MSSDVRVELSTRLWVILALQVVVIALLCGLDRHADAPETGSLLDFDTDAVDGLVIEESGATSLRLERNDAGWRLDPASETDPALAADADKAVAGGGDGLAVNVDVDIVPVRKAGLDFIGAFRVVGAEILHGLIGEHDAPAEGVARFVAFEHGYVVAGAAPLHGDGE